MNPPPGEPRYVICDEDDTDDDSSYTAGDDDSHHSDEGDTAHSSNVANHSDELGDEFDSDYEVIIIIIIKFDFILKNCLFFFF